MGLGTIMQIKNKLYKLHKYSNYEEYKEIQIKRSKELLNAGQWVVKKNIAFLSEYLKKNILHKLSFGLCHGTRSGKEQLWFREYLTGCRVIGTEISDTAKQFPHTIEWDFHHVKMGWLRNVDFIYSNAFDHSYDPERCFMNWMACIKPGGICIIEHSWSHGPEGVCAVDPFGANIKDMPYLIEQWSNGLYRAHEIINAPVKSPNLKYLCFLIIKKFK